MPARHRNRGGPEHGIRRLLDTQAQREKKDGQGDVGGQRGRHDQDPGQSEARHRDPAMSAPLAKALREAVTDRAAGQGSEGPRDPRRRGVDAALEHLEAAILDEIDEEPVEEEVVDVVAQEVARRKQQDLRILQDAPRHSARRRLLQSRRAVTVDQGELRGSHARMLGGTVAHGPPPQKGQQKRQRRRREKRRAPPEVDHEPGDQRSGGGRAERQAGIAEAARKCPTRDRKPAAGHRSARGREERRLRGAHRGSEHDERTHRHRGGGRAGTGDEPDEEVAEAPEHRQDRDGLAPADALGPDAAGELKRRIGPGERRQHGAELHFRQAELMHHRLARDGHVRPQQVPDEARGANPPEYSPPDPAGSGVGGGSSGVDHGRVILGFGSAVT